MAAAAIQAGERFLRAGGAALGVLGVSTGRPAMVPGSMLPPTAAPPCGANPGGTTGSAPAGGVDSGMRMP
jgi:hypothetical protein